MGLVLRALTDSAARPFWTLVGIRAAFWVGTALTLLWTGYSDRQRERTLRFDEYEAYDARTDLLFNTFTRFDAGWFLGIAANGYAGEQAAAFFPLYPLVVHGVAFATRSLVVAGVLVSLVAAGIACVVIAQIARPLLGEGAARDAVLYVALYPVAFVFTSVYSEGLFLALSAGAFLAALRGRPVLAGVLGALAVVTRPVGLALVPALAIALWRRDDRRATVARLTPLALLPAALGLYALYLERRLGDALAFVHAQGTFWARHTSPLGPLGGLWEGFSDAGHGALQVLLHLERAGNLGWADTLGTRDALHFLLLLGALALTWVAWRRLGTAFGVYSAAYLAIVLASPAELLPLVSLPRFLLGDFPLFLALAALTDRRPTARDAVIAVFAAVGGAAAVGFARGTWIA